MANGKAVELPSGNQIAKAGKYLRDLDLPTTVRDANRIAECLDIVQQFRDAHASPMLKVRMGLTSFLSTSGASGVVTQRHKRVVRILRKLRRMRDSGGGTSLPRLEDIGGCRVLLARPDDLRKLDKHIQRKWSGKITRSRDYISEPKAMGYRAVHHVVERDGRKIEVQLRTRGQQEWSDAVESADARLHDVSLKDEQAPESLFNYFRLAGEMIHRRENGLDVPLELASQFKDSRSAVVADGYYSG